MCYFLLHMRKCLKLISWGVFWDYTLMAKSILYAWKFNRDYASILKFLTFFYVLSASCPCDKIHSLQMEGFVPMLLFWHGIWYQVHIEINPTIFNSTIRIMNESAQWSLFFFFFFFDRYEVLNDLKSCLCANKHNIN